MAATRNGTGRRNFAAGSPGRKDYEVLAYLERVERECSNAANSLRENAQTVYLGIKKSGRLPKGVDKIPAARRQRRQWLKMAAAAEKTAEAARTARYRWLQDFGRPGTREGIKKTGFEFT